MEEINTFFRELYSNFNERKIESVISKMTDKVKWANGMDGGYVYGHDEGEGILDQTIPTCKFQGNSINN